MLCELFVLNGIYYYKAYKDHLKMDDDLYRLLNLESNVITESQEVEFFKDLITKDKQVSLKD